MIPHYRFQLRDTKVTVIYIIDELLPDNDCALYILTVAQAGETKGELSRYLGCYWPDSTWSHVNVIESVKTTSI